MLELVRKWIGAATKAPLHHWPEIARWARERQCDFRHVRQPGGFVIDGPAGAAGWRLEWGPSQRSYLAGRELRLRAELRVPGELQALVLSRELKDAMESDVFDQYVEDVQTRMDTRTPPEMRWLVMYPQLGGAELKGLRERWAAVSSVKPWLVRWMDGPLADALAEHATNGGVPVALMVSRGRLALRAALAAPTPASIEKCLKLYLLAMREAQRASAEFTDSSAPSTQPSLWSASVIASEVPAH